MLQYFCVIYDISKEKRGKYDKIWIQRIKYNKKQNTK